MKNLVKNPATPPVALFDVQCGFGGSSPGSDAPITIDRLISEMNRLGVERALARTLPGTLLIDVTIANRDLYADCTRHPRLTPCPIVVPNGADDLASEPAQIAMAIDHGAGAAAIRPRTDGWSLAAWCAGTLFDELASRRLPTVCALEEFSYDDISDLADRYAGLPLVLVGAGYRDQRILLPLLKRFDNVLLSIGSNYLPHRGIEQCVNTLGPHRLLFGTGFPDVDMTGPIAQLMYAEIDDDAQRRIGAENLDRLIGAIQR